MQAERGGSLISLEDLQKQVGDLLSLEKEEHLAPKALITQTGEAYTMVAPTITKRLLKKLKMFNRDGL
ncbi:MAG: hypothetical protein NPIRA05_09200 [Nitrospirales bacterium]|nr:MAG: hypothetical protein NPIRA05_09200 [Nitrospirales bacterium]